MRSNLRLTRAFSSKQRLPREIHSISGDIRDFSQLKSAIAECQPEVVIHMAAQSVVRRGYDDPIETYSSNVMGTVNLFEALRQLKQPCAVVNVTSDKCYENREWVWGYRETEPMGGRIHIPIQRAARNSSLLLIESLTFRLKHWPATESRWVARAPEMPSAVATGPATNSSLISFVHFWRASLA